MAAELGTLLLRTDAAPRMGTGHVMRCLALAQAWQDAGGQPVFVMAESLPGIDSRLEAERMRVERLPTAPASDADARQCLEMARRLSAAWLVLDGYHFDDRFEQSVKKDGLQLLVLDDYGHARHDAADLVLNQNLHAEASLYPARDRARVLLGPAFALLRREFVRCRDWTRQVPERADKLLVTLGGVDADNVTRKVIDALEQQSGELEAVVVVADNNPHLRDLEAAAQRCQGVVRLLRHVQNMPELMMWADMAVAAGGTTSWERAFFGLPGLVIILADNQRPVAEALDKEGLARNLGWHGELSVSALAEAIHQLRSDRERRMTAARVGPRCVDALGAQRVLGFMHDYAVALRPARSEDCRLLWEWANDPAVRSVSFSTEAIPWERHEQWFAAKLNARTCILLLAENGHGTPIGQVRCDVKGDEGTISISMAPPCRGHGQGTRAIRKAAALLFARHGLTVLHALIREGNVASLRAFTHAGFREAEDTTVRGHRAKRLEMRKEK
ncbi:MAG TPA: UDP-2,4-diacetamido-2,4,6-trideoxy-beta-L-altropyranose hydrolase [Gemmataceae bacterium]|jgi:UDP-2,4-diacetamido-2,4,6-trideoxy-beta-L-altropyranose hydrolase|nr:UDP-2,4-diacetamido-2,4,6-trideoxy-beta-L-altropyranose hydrolase [Gemmataceae bacterium]